MCKRPPASYLYPDIDVNALHHLQRTLQWNLQVSTQIIMALESHISHMSSGWDTLEQQVRDNSNSFTDEERLWLLEKLSVKRQDLVTMQAYLNNFRAQHPQMVQDQDVLATVSLALTAGDGRN